VRGAFTIAALSGVLASSCSAAQSSPPTVDDLASSFNSRNLRKFSTLIMNDPIAMVDDVGTVTPLSKKDFVSRIQKCDLNRVFKEGVNYQQSDGMAWICRAQPIAGKPCYFVLYGADLKKVATKTAPFQYGFAVSPLHLTEERDIKNCGTSGLPKPSFRSGDQN
jgi:hypothetical protein